MQPASPIAALGYGCCHRQRPPAPGESHAQLVRIALTPRAGTDSCARAEAVEGAQVHPPASAFGRWSNPACGELRVPPAAGGGEPRLREKRGRSATALRESSHPRIEQGRTAAWLRPATRRRWAFRRHRRSAQPVAQRKRGGVRRRLPRETRTSAPPAAREALTDATYRNGRPARLSGTRRRWTFHAQSGAPPAGEHAGSPHSTGSNAPPRRWGPAADVPAFRTPGEGPSIADCRLRVSSGAHSAGFIAFG